MSTTPEVQTETTLYRKYRPQRFGDVVGQEHVVRVLMRAVVEGRVSHAYLFAGPRGTGKTTLARLLAKRLSCERPKGGEPCNRCAACAAVTASRYLDLIEIDAASNRSIDDVRGLKERIALQPVHGHWKVYIVDEVHMLTKEAFNALLKTLEEPPRHAVFILATTELEKVPETIRSRCQTFLFRRAPVALIVERLTRIAAAEGIAITPEALELLAIASGGCFRDAESLLAIVRGVSDHPVAADVVRELFGLATVTTVQDFIDTVLSRDAHAALELLRRAGKEGSSYTAFTDTLIRLLRSLSSVAVAGVHGDTFAPAEEDRLQKTAHTHLPKDLISILRMALRAKAELRDAVYQELPLELLALEWCGTETASQPKLSPPAESSQDTPAAQNPAPGASPSVQVRGSAVRDTEATESQAVSLDRIISAWPGFLRAAGELHPLLRPIFRAALPFTLREGTLFVLTDHALALLRFKDPRFRKSVEDLLAAAVGSVLTLRLVRERDLASFGLVVPSDLREKLAAELTHTDAADSPATESSLADALTLFGGEVDKGTATP